MRLLILLFLVSCATLTEDERYTRDSHWAEALDQYLDLKAHCPGFIVKNFSDRNLRQVHPVDLKNAICVARVQ
jgi:hypothetical protein